MATVPVLVRCVATSGQTAPYYDEYTLRKDAAALLSSAACSLPGYFVINIGTTYIADATDGLTFNTAVPESHVSVGAPATSAYKYYIERDMEISDLCLPVGNLHSASDATDYFYNIRTGDFDAQPYVDIFGPSGLAGDCVYVGSVLPIYVDGQTGGFSGGAINSKGSLSALGQDVTYSLSWYCVDVYIDSVLYQEGAKDAQMRVDGTTHDFSVTVTQEATDSYNMGRLTGVDVPGSFGLLIETDVVASEWRLQKCEAEVTVTGQTTGPVEFRFRNTTYGLDYQWCLSHLPPIANVVITTDDGTVTLDASASYTIDSPIDTYRLYTSGTPYIDVTQSTPTTGPTDITDQLTNDTAVTGFVTVTDDYGCAGTDSDGPVTVVVNQRTDSADLPSRAVYVFYKSGADLKLAFYPNGSASRSVVATFTGCKSPSFWVKSDSSFRAAMDNGTSYILKSSYDRGATWSSSLATIWNSTNYYKAASCGLKTGGMASVAVKRGTSPAEVYVKVSNDETNWVSDASATLVDTTTSTATQFSIRQKNESGSNAIIISNGTDEIWQSVNGGSTWTSI